MEMTEMTKSKLRRMRKQITKDGVAAFQKQHNLSEAQLRKVGFWLSEEIVTTFAAKSVNKPKVREKLTEQVQAKVAEVAELPADSEMSFELAEQIRRENAAGMSQAALAKKYGKGKSTIGSIVRGQSWKAPTN